MISPSRFVHDTFLEQKVDTVNSRNCLSMFEMEQGDSHVTEDEMSMDHEEVATFVDYRGVFVLGTYSTIPELKWCLLAEINAEEALAPVRYTTNFIVLIIMALMVMVAVLAILISRSISNPIRKLTRTIGDISLGKMDTHISGKDRNDEIGKLAQSFDRVMVSLKLAMKKGGQTAKKEGG